MKAVFVETRAFTDWVSRHLPDSVYSAPQHELMANPDKGVVMRGCGGLRKVRCSDPGRGRGKRSGARIIYLYIAEANQFFMLDAYGKDGQDDLSSDERRLLGTLAAELRRSALAATKPPHTESP